MKTVSEVSRLTGISVRALHHYDEIGLLQPTAVSAAGYRLYDDEAVRKLQTILLFRELRFPLKEIIAIIGKEGYDAETALKQQIKLLELEKEHTERLIVLARDMLAKGVDKMDMIAMNENKAELYREETRERWGKTDAYREYAEKEKEQTDKGRRENAEGLDALFVRFGAIKGQSPDSPEALSLVKELQTFITEHFYHCTDEILYSLGEMYTADERFRAHIDKLGGEGTAAFVSEAIRCIFPR